MLKLELLTIEVAYAHSILKEDQIVIKLTVPQGTTVQQAIIASGILLKFKDLNLQKNKVGIFGEIMDLSTLVKNFDRIEIYRDLYLDPNATRMLRLNLK